MCIRNEKEIFLITALLNLMFIKLKYIQISLEMYQQISYHAESLKKKKYEINISSMKTNQMHNMWQYLTSIKV